MSYDHPPPPPPYSFVQGKRPAPNAPDITPESSIMQPPSPPSYQQSASKAMEEDHILKTPNEIKWVSCRAVEAAAYAQKAVVTGRFKDGSPIWVIRAYHTTGDLLPGKLLAKQGKAFITFSGKEFPVLNVELLCAPPDAIRWVKDKNGQVPTGAIRAGKTKIGEPLYIGRTKYKHIPGKVQPSHGCLYTSKKGKEITHKKYEVLCRAGECAMI